MPEFQNHRQVMLHEINRLKERINELEDSDSKIQDLQEDLEAARELGMAVFECSPDPLFVASFEGKLKRWNRPLETLTGYTPDELTAMNCSQLFDDGQTFQALVEQAGDSGRAEGAVEVVSKNFPRVKFNANLERIHCHGEYCIVCVLFDALQKKRDHALRRSGAVATAKVAMLSRRQKQVFELVVNGVANKNIASQLGISEKTVEMHRAQMMRKLDVMNLASLVRLAVLAELAEPDATPSESSSDVT